MAKKSKKLTIRVSEILAILIGIATITTVALVYRATNKSYRIIDDDISGEKYSIYATYETGKSYYFVGFNGLLTNYFPEQQQEIFDKIAEFIQSVKPKIEKISYKKNSLKASGDEQRFKIDADGDEMTVKLKQIEQKDYELEIYSEKSLLLSYKSAEHRYIQHNPLLLATKQLPVTIKTKDGKPFAVQSTDSKNLNVIINSCGEQSIKDAAVESTKQWLYSINYPSDTYNFITDDFCDRD